MNIPELVCPAGTPAALKAALVAGADSVYAGFRDPTNARNFPGLNFSRPEMKAAAELCRQNNARLFVTINTFPGPEEILWRQAIDDTAVCGADGVILSDPGLLVYAAENHPDLCRHLSVQAAAATPEALQYYRSRFGIARAVLPRVLTFERIAALKETTDVELEIFAFGGLCVMAEGRCHLSAYATGISPNRHGVCSPASHVDYRSEPDGTGVYLGEIPIDHIPENTAAGYPASCKGCYRVNGKMSRTFGQPASLDVRDHLKTIMEIGVDALKIEGRQRGKAYISAVVSAFRRAVDATAAGAPLPPCDLTRFMEHHAATAGAYLSEWA